MEINFRARLVLGSTLQVVAFVATAVFVLAVSTGEYTAEQVRVATNDARTMFSRLMQMHARSFSGATAEYARSPRLLATAAIPDVDDATFAEVLAELKAPIVAVLSLDGRVIGSRGGWPTGTDLGGQPGFRAALAGGRTDRVWEHPRGLVFITLAPLVQGDELLGALLRGEWIDDTFTDRLGGLANFDHVLVHDGKVLGQHWRNAAPEPNDLLPLQRFADDGVPDDGVPTSVRVLGEDQPGLVLNLHADGGLVFLSQDLRGIRDLRNRTLAWLILLGGLLAVAGLFFAARTATRLSRPLRALTSASERMSAGDLSARVDQVDTDDELGKLAHSFNAMAATVQSLVADVTDKAARAEAANRAKDGFLTSVSHELRTPLTGIQSTAELLQQFGDDASPAERAEFLCTILREAERLGRRITDALDFANLAGGRTAWTLGRVDLQQISEEACRRLDSLQAMKAVAFQITAEPGAVLQGDRERLTQAIQHLVHNAWQWSPVDGVVEVTVSAVQAGFRVEVADRGPGIAPQDRARIFDAFTQGGDTLTDKPSGIGIGLKIAREVAQAHGGTIEYGDRAGGGATFRMLLRTSDRPIDRPLATPASAGA